MLLVCFGIWVSFKTSSSLLQKAGLTLYTLVLQKGASGREQECLLFL